MKRDYTRDGADVEWRPDAVRAYLEASGYLIGPDGVSTAIVDARDGTPTVVVTADIDKNVPDDVFAASLDAFVPASDPKATAEVTMRKALAAVRDATDQTPIEDRVATLERVVLAFAMARAGVGP